MVGLLALAGEPALCQQAAIIDSEAHYPAPLTLNADAYNGPDGLKLGPDGNYYIAQNGCRVRHRRV